MLHRTTGTPPDPDLAAIITLTLLRLERFDEACKQLQSALVDYCVPGKDLLSFAARSVIRHPAISLPGWVGRGSKLEMVGELAPREVSSVLDVRIDRNPAFAQLLQERSSDNERRFSLPGLGRCHVWDVRSRGTELIGSGQSFQESFGLDGRAHLTGSKLWGWVRVGWRPSFRPNMRLILGSGDQAHVGVNARPEGLDGWDFCAPRVRMASESRLTVEVKLPSLRWWPLPDSPLVFERAVRLRSVPRDRLVDWRSVPRRRAVRRPAPSPTHKVVDVVIPVYGAREAALACIESVLNTVGTNGRLIVVDDASSDPKLVAELDDLQQHGRIELLRNSENQGFVRSVNRALGLNPDRDVVILNSDALVFGNWLTGLQAAAYSENRIGTVTPFSNQAAIASYPHRAGSELSPP